MKSLTSLPARRIIAGVAGLLSAVSLMTGVKGAGPGAPVQGVSTDEEITLKKVSYRNEPVRVVRVRNRRGEIEPGKTFRDDPTQVLRDFAVTVSNSSGKDITHLSFSLFFPRPEDDEAPQEPPYTFEMAFGVSPLSEHYAQYKKLHPSKLIKRSEVFELALTDEQWGHIMEVLNSLKYPPGIKRVELWLNEVGFDDGTAWKSGSTFSSNSQSEGPQSRAGRVARARRARHQLNLPRL